MEYLRTCRAKAAAPVRATVKAAVYAGVLTISLLPVLATAEPVVLKLSFYASEHTKTYEAGIKPFVDKINIEGKGVLAVKVYPDGALGKALAEQPNLVLDGGADIAWVVPGQTPYRFPDDELFEMPGLIDNVREGTFVFTRLVAARALRGYEDFFVIGAYTAHPTIVHSRKPIDSLAGLIGQKLRTNNPVGAEVLQRLGARPTVMPASRISEAIGRGAIDGATLDPTGLFDFGVAQVTTNHFLLRGGVAPLVLVMNRKKFEGLPETAKVLIRKYSGEAAAAIWVEKYGEGVNQSLEKIRSDPSRKVVEPSPSDLDAAQKIYRSLIKAWTEKSPRNRDLLKMFEAGIASLRSEK